MFQQHTQLCTRQHAAGKVYCGMHTTSKDCSTNLSWLLFPSANCSPWQLVSGASVEISIYSTENGWTQLIYCAVEEADWTAGTQSQQTATDLGFQVHLMSPRLAASPCDGTYGNTDRPKLNVCVVQGWKGLSGLAVSVRVCLLPNNIVPNADTVASQFHFPKHLSALVAS